MTHLRITGPIWLVLCLTGAVAFGSHLRSIITDPQHGIRTSFHSTGFWALQFFVEAFLLLGLVAGFGLLRLKRWGAFCMRVCDVFLLLYCLVFFFISHYVEFHIAWLEESLLGVALSAYGLFVVWRFEPRDQLWGT